MRHPRDSQRSRVYWWETYTLTGLLDREDRTPLTEQKAQALVDLIWRERRPDWTPPEVRIMGNRTRGCAAFGGTWIKLASKHLPSLSAWYVIHEATHAMLNQGGWALTLAPHGPEFTQLYAVLLGEYLETDIDSTGIVDSMEAKWRNKCYRLKVSELVLPDADTTPLLLGPSE